MMNTGLAGLHKKVSACHMADLLGVAHSGTVGLTRRRCSTTVSTGSSRQADLQPASNLLRAKELTKVENLGTVACGHRPMQSLRAVGAAHLHRNDLPCRTGSLTIRPTKGKPVVGPS